MVASFIFNTRAEFLKSKRTAALWLTIIGAAFIPVVHGIMLFSRPDHFVPIFKKDPWNMIINFNWKAATIFLLPMYVILVTSLVVQIEFRNNTWKQVYASPRTIADIFFSRFIVIHALILACFILFNITIIALCCILNLFQKQYTFFQHPVPWQTMFSLIGKIYFSVMAITAIQYWISLRFKNFIAPVGIGLALLITGFIIHDWERLYVYPYMYPAIAFIPDFAKMPGFVSTAQWYNLAWFVVALLTGYLDLVTRKEKG